LRTKVEPERLGLTLPGEYGLFAILRANSNLLEDAYIAQCAKSMVEHLRSYQLLGSGWSTTKGGRMRVGQSLLAESWNPQYARFGFKRDDPSPAFLDAAVDELAKSDQG
jgi:type I restriction enzyme, R subunit